MLRAAWAGLVSLQFILCISFSLPSLAEDWKVRRPRGTLKVVDFKHPSMSVRLSYAEALVTLDKENNWVPCLAEDWRWVGDRTIEFRLRKGVTFHNGESFNAEAVKVNWEEYKKMENPSEFWFVKLPDDTILEVIDEYMVRFTFPQPEALAMVKLAWFPLFAPDFFADHKFEEENWGYLARPGPWGTGAFMLVEGSSLWGKPSEKIVLEAYGDYWDARYPKVKRLIYDNTLIVNREEAMGLICPQTLYHSQS